MRKRWVNRSVGCPDSAWRYGYVDTDGFDPDISGGWCYPLCRLLESLGKAEAGECMKIVKKKLTELRKIEKNVRKHTQKQLNEYVRSVKMFGQIRPLVIDEDGMILAGNGLYDALVAMQTETADCYIVSGLTESQKKKLMLADNRVYELGMTDTDAFEEIVKSLDGDLDVPGWATDLLETLNATIHEVNDMVDSYGSYDAEDIQRINDKRETVSGNAEQADFRPQESGQVNSAPVVQAAEAPSEGQTGAFVICPKCGARIEIGGM